MSKYENKIFINQYIGLWAYGYYNGFTGTESIYRIIKSFFLEEYEKKDTLEILDIGCGVGRTTMDLATIFKKSKIVSIDTSKLSIKMAKKILHNKKKTELDIDLRDLGFKILKIPVSNFDNVKFMETSFDDINEKDKYDLITAVNFLDRYDNIEKAIQKIYDLLKKDGIFIGATPLNFSSKNQWKNVNKNDFLKKILSNNNLKIKEYLKNIIYREILDARGAYNEFYVDIFKVKK